MNADWFKLVTTADYLQALSSNGLKETSMPAVHKFLAKLTERMERVKQQSKDSHSLTKNFYRVLQAPEELYQSFYNSVIQIPYPTNSDEHLYQNCNAGSLRALFTDILICLSRKYPSSETGNHQNSLDPKLTDDEASVVGNETVNYIAGWSLVAARRENNKFTELVERLGQDVQIGGKYVMEPTEEYVSFFKQLSVVVSSQLNMEKYQQFHESLAQKATDSCMRNIGIRIRLNDLLCGTDEHVIIDFLEILVQKVIKSRMRQFLSVNNLAPAKESMALRVTIALKGSDAATNSEVKVSKKPNQTTYCYQGCKSKQTNMVNCSGKNCKGEWFHFRCAGLTSKTVPKGDEPWLCKHCADKMITVDDMSLPFQLLANLIGVEEVLHISYRPTEGREFSTPVVYGVAAGNTRSVKQWFEKNVKHHLRGSIKRKGMRLSFLRVNGVETTNTERCMKICEKIDYLKNEHLMTSLHVATNLKVFRATVEIGLMIVEGGRQKLQSLGCNKEAFANQKRCDNCKKLVKTLQSKPAVNSKSTSTQTTAEPMDVEGFALKPVNTVCQWTTCKCNTTHLTVNDLINHIMSQIDTQDTLSPTYRSYSCSWINCTSKEFHRKSDLRQHIVDRHTGTANEEIRRNVLLDQCKNYGKCGSSKRWTAETIKLCCTSLPTGVLEKARSAGLTLPSSSTIKRYKVFGKARMGWDNHGEEIQQAMKAANVPPRAKYGMICFDEVKIKEGLVYDPHSLELIGVTDEGEIGTHVLQFFWSSAVYGFSHPLAYFITNTASTEDLLSYFWRGVKILGDSGLEVVGTIFDGSPANRRFQDVICLPDERHLAQNICKEKVEHLVIISDPPHLAKRLRNCLKNSGHNPEKGEEDKKEKQEFTRLMSRNGEEILWQHIEELASESCYGWQTYRLNNECLKLNNFSKMKVSLMEKIFDERIVEGLKTSGHKETAIFVEKCTELWKILSSRQLIRQENLSEFKESLIRIQRWFGAWEYEVYSNPDSEPTSCLPPISTLRDVKTTCNGMIALATKCSELGAGLIPGRINQDVVENWFGHQRQACGSNQNMTAAAYGTNMKNLTTSKVIKSSYNKPVDNITSILTTNKPKHAKITKKYPTLEELLEE